MISNRKKDIHFLASVSLQIAQKHFRSVCLCAHGKKKDSDLHYSGIAWCFVVENRYRSFHVSWCTVLVLFTLDINANWKYVNEPPVHIPRWSRFTWSCLTNQRRGSGSNHALFTCNGRLSGRYCSEVLTWVIKGQPLQDMGLATYNLDDLRVCTVIRADVGVTLPSTP